MMEYNTISMPDENEKELAIHAIVKEVTPPKQSLWSLLTAAKGIPLSALFFGVGDCLFLAVMISLVCMVFAVSAAAFEQTRLLPILFLVSPVLYASLYCLTTWKDHMARMLDWKQTCRLSFRTLTALRMLLFGGASTVLCVPQSLLLWYVNGMQLSLLWILAVSFASLFLYAVLTLAFLTHHALIPTILWIGCGILLLCWNQASLFLLQVPTAVFALIAAASLWAMLYNMKRLILRPMEGRNSYAFS